MDVTEIVQELARIERQRKVVEASLLTEPMKKRLMIELDKKAQKLETDLNVAPAEVPAALKKER